MNTTRMLERVGCANRRIARLGLQDTVAIVYMAGEALLLNAAGRPLLRERGRPALAIGLLVLRFERTLFDFLGS